MRFIAYRELVKVLGVANENDEELDYQELIKAAEDKLTDVKHFTISGAELNQTELFHLISLYNQKENKVFSDWVLSDEVLLSFLDDRKNQQFGKVKTYKNHLLEDKYKMFIRPFLLDKLSEATRLSTQKGSFKQMTLYLELSSLLPQEEKFIVQHSVANYIEDKLAFDYQEEQARTNHVMSKDYVAVIEKLDDSFYALKVTFTGILKDQFEKGSINRSKAKAFWEQLGLNKAHLAELENYMDKRQDTFQNAKPRSFRSFIKYPVFIFSVLVAVVLTLFFLLGNGKQVKEVRNDQQNRTGLDSLSKDEAFMADTILGYKSKDDSNIITNKLVPDM